MPIWEDDDEWRQRLFPLDTPPCHHFGWCPPEDDTRPTQMWFPISHGPGCKGHRQYVGWINLQSNRPVFFAGRNYYIEICDKWKDAL